MQNPIKLAAHSYAPHATDLYTTLPTEPEYHISNIALQLAVRSRLGLLPSNDLAGVHCCCSTETSFSADPDHLHSCIISKHYTVTQRHNHIRDTLIKLAREQGFYAEREPTGHAQPNDLDSNGQPTGAPSTSTVSSRTASIPLHSVKAPIRKKHVTYDGIAARNGYKMIALALETYGGFSPEASKLLKTIAVHSTELDSKSWLRHAYSTLAIVLATANANLQLIGQQRMLTRARQLQTPFAASRVFARARAQARFVPLPRTETIAALTEPERSAIYTLARSATTNQLAASPFPVYLAPEFSHSNGIPMFFADRPFLPLIPITHTFASSAHSTRAG
jgi:hypothetical protein